MSFGYRALIRPLLFTQGSERIHDRTLQFLAWASRHSHLCKMLAAICKPARLPVDLFGLSFPNPVGLAAGMDKYARAVPVWQALGFGFCELGGVTLHPQTGNPKPRMFRVRADQALVNRMGFNNPGAEAVAEQLARRKKSGAWPSHPVGVNLGKSKITPLENAADDYAESFRVLRNYADFFVVNISSPNTPNLRQLQDKTALDEILAALQEKNAPNAKPILIKLAPDLSFEALDEIVEVIERRKIAGLVATNTTIARPHASSSKADRIYAEAGGLSGAPLRGRSTEVIRHLYRQTKGTLPLIGVGGIFNAADAWEKIIAGASLVQIYTGLVYEGPSIAKHIVAGLRKRLREHGLNEIQQAVGLDRR